MQLDEFLTLAMVEWSATYERLHSGEAHAHERAAAALATHAARLSAYLSRRLSGGTHDDAVKAQNRAARGVRQALGYTYADDRVTF